MNYNKLLLYYARNGLFEPLRKSAYRKFCRRNKGKSAVSQTKKGFLMATTIGDSVDDLIYVHGLYEPETTHVISTISPDCDCFIDVGCNIGYYSCIYCSDNPHGKVFAIDPNPQMIQRTEQNLKLNGFTNYRMLNYGVASENGKLRLNILRFRHSLSSFAYIPNRGGGGAVDSIDVETKPLTDIISSENIRNALLKVDTEGFEYQVFSGLSEETVERIKYIVFELSSSNLNKAGISPSSIFTIPSIQKFSVFSICKQGVIAEVNPQILTENEHINNNILLVRKDIALDQSLPWKLLL